MKVKGIERSVNTSWSPADQHPILLAAGTAAQQLDASFSTSAALEIYALNLSEPTLDLDLKASTPSQHRFHKLAWGGTSPGVIVGGCDSGVVQMYNASKIMANEDGLIASPERHTGPVRALDFNPYQKNLLATGATNSEIFIWDMNNTATPMTPGAKSQPFEDVAWLSWNRQASAFCTRSAVWDLRKNEPVIPCLGLSSSFTPRVRWKAVAWHPEIATQLCLASEEDSNPIIQLWDLRFTTAPLKSFQGHSKGVLSLAWCNQDADLLISSGKDNKILCWNPNSTNPEGEIICEIPNTQQWIFDVSWCPRNPSLIVSSSCDGHTSIYSLTGGPAQAPASNKIADSFPGMGDYKEQVHAQQPIVELKKAPKWFRKTTGARFGFGGKLITFGPDGIKLCQVHEDDGFLAKARELNERLVHGRHQEICQGKKDPVWQYLEASFSQEPRLAIVDLLGYNKDKIISSLGLSTKHKNDVDYLTNQMSALNQNHLNCETLNGGDIFDSISAQNSPERTKPFKLAINNNDVESKICKALLVGGVEEAINICINEGNMADALVLAMTAGPDVLAKTQLKYFQKREGYLTKILNALVTENWSDVVMGCDLSSWKEVLTAILMYSSDDAVPGLCQELGTRLENGGQEFSSSAEICYIASGHIAPLIQKRTAGVKLSSENIQELVELVLVAQGAMASHNQTLDITGDVAKLIALYSEILASEGDLMTALQFLSDSTDECMNDLRDRLSYALGLKTLFTQANRQQAPYQQPQYQQPQPYQQQAQPRKTSLSFQGLPQQQMGMAQQPMANPYNPPAPISQSPAPLGSFGMPPMPAKAAPPPPTSFRNSPSPKVQGNPGMKKYLVDPSVGGGFQSNTYNQPGNTYGSVFPQQTKYGQPENVPIFQPPGSTYLQNQTYHGREPQYGAPNPPVQHFQPNYQEPAIPVGTLQFNQQPKMPTGPPPSNTNTVFNPNSYNQQAPILTGREMASTQHDASSGWNDPPVLSASRNKPKPEEMSAFHSGLKVYDSKKRQQQEIEHLAPITHPIFKTAPPVGTEMPVNLFQPQHQQQQQPPIQNMPQSAPQPAYGEPPVSLGRPALPSRPKIPMPPELQPIQSAFDGLRDKCAAASNNPMIKRKLEDVTKKLETLYDRLKDGMLSTSAISGLEQLANCVSNSDFTSGLHIITQMVSGPDFSQVSSFMTGLKILLQIAQQLGISA